VFLAEAQYAQFDLAGEDAVGGLFADDAFEPVAVAGPQGLTEFPCREG
jgi:hypothetical protein